MINMNVPEERMQLLITDQEACWEEIARKREELERESDQKLENAFKEYLAEDYYLEAMTDEEKSAYEEWCYGEDDEVMDFTTTTAKDVVKRSKRRHQLFVARQRRARNSRVAEDKLCHHLRSNDGSKKVLDMLKEQIRKVYALKKVAENDKNSKSAKKQFEKWKMMAIRKGKRS